jgi:hypothetical protein
VRRGGTFALAAVEVARRQVPTPLCGTPCHARPHPAPSPEMGLSIPIGPKSHIYGTKGQLYPAGYAYRLESYHGVKATLHCKEYLCHRHSPSLPLWMTMCLF